MPALWNRFSSRFEFWLSHHNGIPLGNAATLVLMKLSEDRFQSVDVLAIATNFRDIP